MKNTKTLNQRLTQKERYEIKSALKNAWHKLYKGYVPPVGFYPNDLLIKKYNPDTENINIPDGVDKTLVKQAVARLAGLIEVEFELDPENSVELASDIMDRLMKKFSSPYFPFFIQKGVFNELRTSRKLPYLVSILYDLLPMDSFPPPFEWREVKGEYRPVPKKRYIFTVLTPLLLVALTETAKVFSSDPDRNAYEAAIIHFKTHFPRSNPVDLTNPD